MEKEIDWLLKEKYNNKPNKIFYKDIERLKAGEPLDYVVGFTEFLGYKIDLSQKPLIPRPETEFWVEKSINELFVKNTRSRDFCEHSKNKKNNLKILDMFAGSGCIGIAILSRVKNAEVVFADKDKKCIEQIKINLKINSSLIRANNGYTKKIKSVVVWSDVFSNIKGKYDYIFANPPYIPAILLNRIQKSVLKFEPKTALFGGGDGLFYIRKFLKQAKAHLRRPASAKASARQSKIFMEFSPEQKRGVEGLIKEYNYKNYEFHKDQYGRWRWVVIG